MVSPPMVGIQINYKEKRGTEYGWPVDIAPKYPTFDQFTKFIVSSCKSIKFWEDRWCDNPPNTFFQTYFRYQARKTHSLRSVGTTSNNLGTWPSEEASLIESWATG